MTSSSVPNPLSGLPATPQYIPGATRGSVLARFAGGPDLPVLVGRVRSYPGLRADAPSMTPFYDAFGELVPAARALDAGSGSGAGARRLQERGFRVTAVEVDPAAVAFARRYAPSVEHVEADLAIFGSDQPFDSAIVADVLGHAIDPEACLVAVARALAPEGRLLVAEPAAHVSQRLTAPHRRSFSLQRLRALLVRSGFVVEATLCSGIPYLALLARSHNPSVREAFASAYAAAGRGRLDDALTAIDGIHSAGNLEVELERTLARAELHLAAGNGDEAAQACFRARELCPNDARPSIGLSRIALAGGALADALHLALDALERDPTEAAACALAAFSAQGLGHPDSVTAWRTASNLAPDDYSLAKECALAASRCGDHSLALHGLDRLERYGTPEPDFHVTRSWILLSAGRKAEAAIEARIAGARGAVGSEIDELLVAIAAAS